MFQWISMIDGDSAMAGAIDDCHRIDLRVRTI